MVKDNYKTIYDSAWKQILGEERKAQKAKEKPKVSEVEEFIFLEKFGLNAEPIESALEIDESSPNALVFKTKKTANNFGYVVSNQLTGKKDLFIIDLLRPKKQLLTLKQTAGFNVSLGKNYLRVCFDHNPIYLQNAVETWYSRINNPEPQSITEVVVSNIEKPIVKNQITSLFKYASKRICPVEVDVMCKNNSLTEDQALIKFGEFLPQMRDLTYLLLNYEFEE